MEINSVEKWWDSFGLKENLDLIESACLGDKEAIDFIKILFYIFRIWDNVQDEDKPYNKLDILNCFTLLATNYANNSFYQKHRDVLDSQIFVSWNCWKDANIWEEDEDVYKKRSAWHIREYCNEILTLCAFLIGGLDNSSRISLRARELFLDQALQDGDSY